MIRSIKVVDNSGEYGGFHLYIDDKEISKEQIKSIEVADLGHEKIARVELKLDSLQTITLE